MRMRKLLRRLWNGIDMPEDDGTSMSLANLVARGGVVATPGIPLPTTIGQFPHCDQRMLHAPGECKYCDHHPEWQELRDAWGVAFSGHAPTSAQVQCPFDHNRPGGSTWGGNQPVSGLSPTGVWFDEIDDFQMLEAMSRDELLEWAKTVLN